MAGDMNVVVKPEMPIPSQIGSAIIFSHLTAKNEYR